MLNLAANPRMDTTTDNRFIEEQINSKETQLQQAILSSDLQSLQDLLHPALQFVNPDGSVVGKATDIEAHRSGTISISSITSSEMNITGKRLTVIVTLLQFLKGTYEGQPFEGNYRYLRVWHYDDKDWKVVAGSCTPIQLV